MLANPEMVAGTRDRLDTSLMKALPGRVVSKGGMEALRGLAILAGARGTARRDGHRASPSRSRTAAATSARPGRRRSRPLRQAGLLDGRPSASSLATTGPPSLDPHGRVGAEAIAEFDLAPVGELIG